MFQVLICKYLFSNFHLPFLIRFKEEIQRALGQVRHNDKEEVEDNDDEINDWTVA